MNLDYDLIIIGGGIQGAGVAQAAAAAGHKALLLEQRAIGWATSSRSSKLIHGGLRYLETAQFGLVRDSLRERETLLRIAPDLVRLVPFHIPVYEKTQRRPWKIRAGLSLYALLGGLGPHARFRELPRTEWPLSDGLVSDRLQTVFRYWDAQTDDQLLTRAVVASAKELGVDVRMPARFHAARRHDQGYTVEFEEGSEIRQLGCRAIVNASGPWIPDVLRRIDPLPPTVEIELVQGAHIVVPREMHEGIYYAEAPRDGRAVFVMPWHGHTLVGTTETPFRGDPAQVQPTSEEITYLQETIQTYFPDGPTDVAGSFAGLRVLPRSTGSFNRRPRETRLVTDTRRAPRLLSIVGGKLTGYRSTALKVLRKLRGVLPTVKPLADTAEIELHRPTPDREEISAEVSGPGDL